MNTLKTMNIIHEMTQLSKIQKNQILIKILIEKFFLGEVLDNCNMMAIKIK